MKFKNVKLNLKQIFKLSDFFKKRLEEKFDKKNISIENNNILSGYYGIVAAFSPQIDKFSKKYNKTIYDSYKKVGKRNLVAGQEDLIPDIISPPQAMYPHESIQLSKCIGFDLLRAIFSRVIIAATSAEYTSTPK